MGCSGNIFSSDLNCLRHAHPIMYVQPAFRFDMMIKQGNLTTGTAFCKHRTRASCGKKVIYFLYF